MSKPIFKSVVKEHIEKVSLSQQQLTELQQLMATGKNDPIIEADINEPKKRLWVGYALVASLGILFGVLLNQQINIMPSNTDFIQVMASEVARNHRQLIPLEVTADTMSLVSSYFKGLSFKPIRTSLLDYKNIQITGGRYCSLNGITAAQIRLRRSGNPNLQTLYQVEYQPEFYASLPNVDKGEKPLVLNIEGLEMTTWVEKDLVFALTNVR